MQSEKILILKKLSRKKIAIKKIRIKLIGKETKGRWNHKKKLFKIISNKTNIN